MLQSMRIATINPLQINEVKMHKTVNGMGLLYDVYISPKA
jgi:hypothetical protein